MSRPSRNDSGSLKASPDGQLPRPEQTGISRREAVQRTLFGTAGLLLPNWLGTQNSFAAQSATQPGGRPTATAVQGKAKAVIQIWAWGGPSPPRHL